jgi:hypothetical protein
MSIPLVADRPADVATTPKVRSNRLVSPARWTRDCSGGQLGPTSMFASTPPIVCGGLESLTFRYLEPSGGMSPRRDQRQQAFWPQPSRSGRRLRSRTANGVSSPLYSCRLNHRCLTNAPPSKLPPIQRRGVRMFLADIASSASRAFPRPSRRCLVEAATARHLPVGIPSACAIAARF